MTVMFFSHRFPSICSWESCTLMAFFGSPALFVPYSCDHVQRPRFAPDKYTSKHTPFWGFAKLCMSHLSPGLSFLSQRATQHFGGSSLCSLSLLSHNTVRWARPQPSDGPRLTCSQPIDTWVERDAYRPAKGESMNTHGAKCFPRAVWMDQAETGLSTLEILENSTVVCSSKRTASIAGTWTWLDRACIHNSSSDPLLGAKVHAFSPYLSFCIPKAHCHLSWYWKLCWTSGHKVHSPLSAVQSFPFYCASETCLDPPLLWA